MDKTRSKCSLLSATTATEYKKRNISKQSSLSMYLHNDTAKNFITENKTAIRLFSKELSKSRNISKKNLQILTPSKYEQKKLLTSYDISKLSFLDKVPSKPKCNVLGVEEGLISLPLSKSKPSSVNTSRIIYSKINQNIKSHTRHNTPLNTSTPDEHLQYVNEIRKLNHWDYKHAAKHKGSQKVSLSMQIFLNNLGQSSMKWLLDIKSDEKQLTILKRNKYLNDFLTRFEREQKAIFNQNMNINKTNFDFSVFDANFVSRCARNENYSQMDYYKEIMKQKKKIEEILRNDLKEIANEVFELKMEKKKIAKNIWESKKSLERIDEKFEKVKRECKEESEKMKIEMEKKNNSDKKKNSRMSIKDIKFRNKNIFIEFLMKMDKKKNENFTKIEQEKVELEYRIEFLSGELEETIEKIEKTKIKLSQRIKTLSHYYFEILKKGFDVRCNGLVWVVVKLIALKANITYENFPNFLTNEHIRYLLKISYLTFEIREIINLFNILKKKQKKLKDENFHKNLNFFQKNEKKHKIRFKSESPSNSRRINLLSKKYENSLKFAVNEENYIASLYSMLHDKIIQSNTETEKNENSVLPDSLIKFCSENSKYREYFNDILYLKNEILKKEKNLSSIKNRELQKFREENKNKKTVQTEMIYAALFGNGISI